jgi:hypothetical protein
MGLLEQGNLGRANALTNLGGSAFGSGLGAEQSITDRLGTGAQLMPTIQEAPLDMYGAIGDVGLGRREMEQQRLDEAVNAWNYNENLPDQKLANYMNLIQGNYGQSNTTQQQRGGLGLAGTLGNIAGGGAAVAGLLGA